MTLARRLIAIKQWLDDREREHAIARFTCAHCDRNASCGRAPSAECLEKLEQVDRSDDWHSRPSAALAAKFPYS